MYASFAENRKIMLKIIKVILEGYASTPQQKPEFRLRHTRHVSRLAKGHPVIHIQAHGNIDH